MPQDTVEVVPLAEVRKMIRERVETLGGSTAAAKCWGVSLQMVSMVLSEKRNPTPSMLEDVGIEKIEPDVEYRRKPKP